MTFWASSLSLSLLQRTKRTVSVQPLHNYAGALEDWFPLLDKKATNKSESKKERGQLKLIVTWLPEGKKRMRLS